MNQKYANRFAVILSAAMCVMGVSVCRGGVTNWWISGSADWNDPGSFKENRVPEAGDVVSIPDDVTAYVTNASSYNVVKKLSWIRFNSATSRLVVNVPEGETWVFECTIRTPSTTSGGAYLGGLEKSGKGDLEFAIGENTRDIQFFVYTPITVREGAVVMPQNYYYDDGLSTKKTHCRCGPVTVDAGAYFVTSRQNSGTADISHAVTHTPELWGYGTISNRCKTNHRIIVDGMRNTSRFYGVIGSKVRYHQVGYVDLLGDSTLSTSDTTVGGGGIVGVKTFGYDKNDSASSIPKGALEVLSSGTFRYLGTGETTAKSVLTRNVYENGPAIFDGGTNGALVMTGTFHPLLTHASAGYMHLLELTGDHPNACEISGSLSSWEYGDSPNPATYTVKKTGSGTWKFSNDANPWSGALFIENGTLQTTSIGNIGEDCAIGSATNRTAFEEVSAADAPSSQLPYALCLGGAATSGTLEYVGESRVDVTNRPVVLTGKGGAIVNSSASALTYRGVSALADATDASLTVGGDSQADNVIANVTDGNGKVSLVKDGSGRWTLGGVNSFSGTLSVKAGTLYVNDPTKYSWFRWILMGRWDETKTDSNVKIAELGIYDENNNRINGGLAWDTSYSPLVPGSLPPGSCAIDKEGTLQYIVMSNTFPLDAMFDDGTRTDGYNTWANVALKDENDKVVPVKFSDPSTYVPVVMRLENGAARAFSFDVAQGGNSTNTNRYFKAFAFEGSIDGIHWDTLTNVTVEVLTSEGWVGTGEVYRKGTAGTHEGGIPISGGPAGAVPALNGVKSVAVSAGARLVSWGDIEISGLTLDANGAGSIENFSFAEEGTLYIDNFTGSVSELPGTFVNCSGVDNIAGWRLELGESVTAKRRIRMTADGKIILVPYGTVVNIR